VVYKKLLELDPNTVDSAKEGAPVVSGDVPADREEVIVMGYTQYMNLAPGP
jgi:hypothetical protein